MPDPIHLIPLPEIDEAAVGRDRTASTRPPSPSSATRSPSRPAHADRGLALGQPHGPHRYGLISGFRRLAAVRALAEPPRQDPLRRHPRLRPHPEGRRGRLPPDGRGERHPRRGLPLGAGDGRRRIRPRRSPGRHRRRHRGVLRGHRPPEAHPPARHRPPGRRARRLAHRPPKPCRSASSSASPPDPPRLRRPDPRHPHRHPRRPGSRMERPPPDPPRGRAPRARDRHPDAPRPPAPHPRPRRRASASAASAPAPAGRCTSRAATPPATSWMASSTRSSACSARPRPASPKHLPPAHRRR